jgi:hypothetical protein
MKITDQLPPTVLAAIRQNLGAKDKDDTSKDWVLNHMKADELFQSYCVWNGLLGDWSYQLSSALDNIRAAVKQTGEEKC